MQFLKNIGLIILLFSSQISVAQNYLVEKYSNANNLDSNEILKIYLDKRENLWVTTRFGIMIKDMNHFNVLKQFNELKFNNVWDIIEDQNDNLWFASYGRGILFFDGQVGTRFSTKDGLISDRFRKFKMFRGKLYAAGVDGISIIDVQSKQIKSFKISVPKNQVFECSAFIEMNGKLYVTSISHGVYEITENGLKLTNPYSRILTSFTFKNNLLLSSNDGVSLYKQSDFIQNKKPFHYANLPIIWDMENVGNDIYWMATYDLISSYGGILEYDAKDNTILAKDITKSLNINANQPNDLVFDQENNVVYISTLDNGLYRLLVDLPIVYNDLADNMVTDIVSHQGKDYILTKDKLYYKNDSNPKILIDSNTFWNYFQKHKYRFKPNSLNERHFFNIDFSQRIESLKLDRILVQADKVWVGSNIGLFEVDLSGEIIGYYPIHTYNFTFLEDKLIECHPFGGVKIFDDLKHMKYTYYSESLDNVPSSVVSITQNNNAVFFGSSLDGLFKYEKGKFISYNTLGVFNERKIKHVKCFGQDELLVATEFGDVYLFQIIQDKLKLLKKINSNTLESSNISFVNKFEDKIIIGSFLGLTINQGSKNYLIDEEQGVDYKAVTSSALHGSSLLIGVDHGYYAIDVNKFVNQKIATQKLMITGVKINDEKYGRDKFKWFDLIDKELNLPFSKNNIYIDFALVNPKFPSKYKYRYRLNASEKWSEYFSDEFIHFNSLKNGNYFIDLEITDLNTSTVTILPLIKVKIAPPFYLSPLFIALLLVIIGLILYRFYRIKINNINDINALKIKQIEEIKDVEKKRILLEKKMSEVRLMALQSQMNPHFIFNILNSIQYYIIDNDIENALESLSNFATLIRKMLDVSSANYVTLKDEIKFLDLYVSVENYRYKNKIVFEVVADQSIDFKSCKIPPMLLQPLVENAFVHAFQQNNRQNKIQLIINVKEQFLVVEVVDNGIGLENSSDKEKFHQSKGLQIIRERMQIFNNDEGNFLRFLQNNPGTRAILYFNLDRLKLIAENFTLNK